MKNLKKNKISLCTVSMNRLHHLMQTLPKNIEDNIDYDNLEFVVLNYNSKDAIDEWVTKKMGKYLDSGILQYYKTTEPESFQHSHAKNAVAKCAKGNIICNVDADNFIGKGFVDYVNKVFTENKNVFIATPKNAKAVGCYGRICAKASDFYKITGYDETMKGYGFEDFDLTNRLEMLPLTRIKITNSNYLNAISHDDGERLKDEKNSVDIQRVFARKIDYKSVQLLFLFKNSEYCHGELLYNRLQNSQSLSNIFPENREYEYEHSIKQDKWEKGLFKFTNGRLMLLKPKFLSGLTKDGFNETENYVAVEDFFPVEDEARILSMKMFYSQISNRIKMLRNRSEKSTTLNQVSFGKVNLVKL
ncbi:glycosyltransferase [Maribacter sp. 2-571]|uniref:glycosyltransferase n=1 Tax=Maribacter sp. 2-571 TaxID=3417569 RepID=UPI003D3391DE